jgi:hypothetical protein
MDEDKKIDDIVGKIMESEPFEERDEYSKTSPEIDKIAARSGARTGPPEKAEKPQSYEDWVKAQPKPKNIGIH